MPDPLKPDVSPIVDGGKAVATGAAKAAAGGVAKVAAWHTISLATAAALGLGGGGDSGTGWSRVVSRSGDGECSGLYL